MGLMVYVIPVAVERGGAGNAGKTGVGRKRSTSANHTPATVTLETFVEQGLSEVGGEHQMEICKVDCPLRLHGSRQQGGQFNVAHAPHATIRSQGDPICNEESAIKQIDQAACNIGAIPTETFTMPSMMTASMRTKRLQCIVHRAPSFSARRLKPPAQADFHPPISSTSYRKQTQYGRALGAHGHTQCRSVPGISDLPSCLARRE